MQSFGINHLSLIATAIFSLITGINAFSYKDAKNWGKKYPECNGKHQSPIIFPSTHGKRLPEISRPLNLTNFYDLPKRMTLKNTGHAVEIIVDWYEKPPMVTGGPLHGNYVFEKITFHWAQNGWTNGIQPKPSLEDWNTGMEMQLVFYKEDLKSFEKAQSQKNGLAIFRLWMDASGIYSDVAYEELEENVKKVQSIHRTAVIIPFDMTSSLDERTASFVFYEGSLAYPPCSESVTWFISPDQIPISDYLLKEFRKIKLAEGDDSNVRPPQPLNNRQLKRVYSHKEHD